MNNHSHSHFGDLANQTTKRLALSAHIVTDDILISAGVFIQQNLNKILAHKYNIQHAALQLERAGCENNLLFCDISKTSHEHKSVTG
ncbi:MAG: hypothetical protein Q7J80_15515 [Anaerolineales bacterium]|nr:hypothetical protein [Anaerolineales bacterium]